MNAEAREKSISFSFRERKIDLHPSKKELKSFVLTFSYLNRHF